MSILPVYDIKGGTWALDMFMRHVYFLAILSASGDSLSSPPEE